MSPTPEHLTADPGRESWHGLALRGSGRVPLEEAWSLIREIAATDPILRDLALDERVEVAICPSRTPRMAYAAAMINGASAGTPRATTAAMTAILVLANPARPTPIADARRYGDVYTLELEPPPPSASVRAANRASAQRRANLDARYLAAADRLEALGKKRVAQAMRKHLKDPSQWSR